MVNAPFTNGFSQSSVCVPLNALKGSEEGAQGPHRSARWPIPEIVKNVQKGLSENAYSIGEQNKGIQAKRGRWPPGFETVNVCGDLSEMIWLLTRLAGKYGSAFGVGNFAHSGE
jgi:hypothetical protein